MPQTPVNRRLRVLAFDPSTAIKLETAKISFVTLNVPWEDDLKAGPVGEYLEVVDFDPASKVFYHPVDLNEAHVLAQDGVTPSESDPHFHQQMVYAVAMMTIRNFERALGRVLFWGDHRAKNKEGQYVTQFVRRLRIYPHALRERNAYYSPAKKALLFGYFPVTKKDKDNMPGTMVFTCLSHDIIAHEVTHAILDGLHPRFNEPTNPDVHAFHEAFSDIVAIFQHFTYPALLENQISKTRGNLETENLLSQLAQQFGRSTGRGNALRDALGEVNPQTNRWELRQPDLNALENTFEPHSRGAILVAAVFRAFLLIYRDQSKDLYRIATQGTGQLPDGDIHPDLTKRLAKEAAKCADRVLQMCIRAIDYCPPVDITFGDFLRSVLTADLEYMPEDKSNYRLVFLQSFREWGIYPKSVITIGLDTLVWPDGLNVMNDLKGLSESYPNVYASLKPENMYTQMALQSNIKQEFFSEGLAGEASWMFEEDRFELWRALRKLKKKFHSWLTNNQHKEHLAQVFGLVLSDLEAKPTVFRDRNGYPTVEVHSVRPTMRKSVYGGIRTDYVVEITQRRRGFYDPDEQKERDQPGAEQPDSGDFRYRAGCTLIIDQATQAIRRIIRTDGDINKDERLERIRAYLLGDPSKHNNAFDAGMAESLRGGESAHRDEPFALLHSQLEE
ncbi:MAG: hypothetical protein AAGJ18_04310 [Bacteroidota bacterium]